MSVVLIAVALVDLHGPSGQHIALNPAEISSLRAPIDIKGHWAQGTKCIAVMTNGGLNALAEPCAIVEQKLKGSN